MPTTSRESYQRLADLTAAIADIHGRIVRLHHLEAALLDQIMEALRGFTAARKTEE